MQSVKYDAEVPHNEATSWWCDSKYIIFLFGCEWNKTWRSQSHHKPFRNLVHKVFANSMTHTHCLSCPTVWERYKILVIGAYTTTSRQSYYSCIRPINTIILQVIRWKRIPKQRITFH